MTWLCFLCLVMTQGPPAYERQALPSGLMLRACSSCWEASPSVERIEAAAAVFVERGGKR